MGADLRQSMDLLRVLVARDMKLRYKRSALGLLWTLANPLSQLLVFLFVFRILLRIDIENYSAFLFSGIIAWNWTSASLLQATTSVVDNRDLIHRPRFPDPILPMVTVASHLVHFLLTLPVLMGLLVFTGIPPTAAVAFLPVLILLQFVLILGVGYMVASFHVTFRDTQYLLGIALMLGFYLTPIFYSTETVPERYRWLYRINPMTYVVDCYRAVLIDGRIPGLSQVVPLALSSALLLGIGYWIFMSRRPRFVEEL